MRQKIHAQLPITPVQIDHEHARELAAISNIIDELSELPTLLERIDEDLRRGSRADTGRPGMTAEQVFRALIVKQMNGFSYSELAFHLADSSTYRSFCRIGIGDKPLKSTCPKEPVVAQLAVS